MSTVASAKGYDAPQVIIVSANEFPDDVEGRVSLYVACTRAREWLEAFAHDDTALICELRTAIKHTEAATTG